MSLVSTIRKMKKKAQEGTVEPLKEEVSLQETFAPGNELERARAGLAYHGKKALQYEHASKKPGLTDVERNWHKTAGELHRDIFHKHSDLLHHHLFTRKGED